MSEALGLSQKPKWYLNTKGAAEGPHSDEAIASQLLSRTLSPATLASFEGAPSWKPLSDWPEFSEICRHVGKATDGSPTLPALPQKKPWMLKAILWYALVIAPSLWVLGHVTCFTRPFELKTDSPFSSTELTLKTGDEIGNLVVRTMLFVMATRAAKGKPKSLAGLHHLLWALLIFILTLGFFEGVITELLTTGAGPEGLVPKTDASNLCDFVTGLFAFAEIPVLIMAISWISRKRRETELPGKGGT